LTGRTTKRRCAAAGETQQGWWKIQCTTCASANDTTTWTVSLVGNPVHLVAIP